MNLCHRPSDNSSLSLPWQAYLSTSAEHSSTLHPSFFILIGNIPEPSRRFGKMNTTPSIGRRHCKYRPIAPRSLRSRSAIHFEN